MPRRIICQAATAESKPPETKARARPSSPMGRPPGTAARFGDREELAAVGFDSSRDFRPRQIYPSGVGQECRAEFSLQFPPGPFVARGTSDRFCAHGEALARHQGREDSFGFDDGAGQVVRLEGFRQRGRLQPEDPASRLERGFGHILYEDTFVKGDGLVANAMGCEGIAQVPQQRALKTTAGAFAFRGEFTRVAKNQRL